MNKSIFFFRPHFDECTTPEPSLRMIVEQYYERYYSKEVALEYTARYFAKYFNKIGEQYK